MPPRLEDLPALLAAEQAARAAYDEAKSAFTEALQALVPQIAEDASAEDAEARGRERMDLVRQIASDCGVPISTVLSRLSGARWDEKRKERRERVAQGTIPRAGTEGRSLADAARDYRRGNRDSLSRVTLYKYIREGRVDVLVSKRTERPLVRFGPDGKTAAPLAEPGTFPVPEELKTIGLPKSATATTDAESSESDLTT